MFILENERAKGKVSRVGIQKFIRRNTMSNIPTEDSLWLINFAC